MGDTRQLEERCQRLEKEGESLRSAILLLHRVANLVRAANELEPTYYAILTGVTAGVGLGLNRAMLFLPEEGNRRRLRGVAAVGPADAEEADRVWRSIEADAPDLETLYKAGLHQLDRSGRLDLRVRGTTVELDGGSPIAISMREGRKVAGEGSDDLGGLLHLPTCVAAPLRGRDASCGVLYGDSCFTSRRLPEVEALVFSLVADHAGRAIEGARRFEAVALDARTDALTGLGHHGAFMEDLARTVREAKGPVGLVMVDIDDFKAVNDTYGNLAGDTLLVRFADRIVRAARGEERPYRYGGEEFAVLLPGANRQAASAVAERIRRAVADAPFVVRDSCRTTMTCSLGAASLPEDSSSALTLVARADAALLEAKERGKNRVVAPSS